MSFKGTISLVASQQPRVYPCRTVQDGHSFAEDRLYNALWNWNQAREETPDTRLVTIGWDVMAKISGMTPRNAKENCRRLIEKLSFERVRAHDSDTRTGTTYRVFGFRVILQKRREVGLEWIIRNRGGVTFVNQAPQTSKGTESSKDKDTVSSKDTVPSEVPVTVPSEAPVTVPSEDTLLVNIVKESQSSSSEIADVLYRLTGELPDDDATNQLLEACQRKDPNITPAAIADLVEQKLRKRPPIKSSIMGFLISAVPKMIRAGN